MKKFLMPISEYNRIHRVAHGVLRDVADVERACIFFATFGSLLLNQHYNIAARPVAGVLALCVSDKPDVACFGEQEGNQLISNSNAFHMWVQTETHIIDFMAPIFPEAFAKHKLNTTIPRLMLQKKITEEVASYMELAKLGDFLTLPNPNLTEALLENFFRKPGNSDLLQVGAKWFGRRSAKQKSTMVMQNDLGEIYNLRLSSNSASSSW